LHVCTIVVQKCVDSNTGLPLTFGVVERALREVHFAVHLAKAAKQQALAAIKVLEQNFPICRAKMRIRVELSASVDCAEVRRLIQQNLMSHDTLYIRFVCFIIQFCTALVFHFRNLV
jgi:ribosome maturation protein SDO1